MMTGWSGSPPAKPTGTSVPTDGNSRVLRWPDGPVPLLAQLEATRTHAESAAISELPAPLAWVWSCGRVAGKRTLTRPRGHAKPHLWTGRPVLDIFLARQGELNTAWTS